jgi:hypothetical protein
MPVTIKRLTDVIEVISHNDVVDARDNKRVMIGLNFKNR